MHDFLDVDIGTDVFIFNWPRSRMGGRLRVSLPSTGSVTDDRSPNLKDRTSGQEAVRGAPNFGSVSRMKDSIAFLQFLWFARHFQVFQGFMCGKRFFIERQEGEFLREGVCTRHRSLSNVIGIRSMNESE